MGAYLPEPFWGLGEVLCRDSAQRHVFVVDTSDSLAVSFQFLGHVACAYSVLRLLHSTFAFHLSTMIFFHRLSGVVELDTGPERCSIGRLAWGLGGRFLFGVECLLLSSCVFLPSSATLVAFGVGSGSRMMWTKKQATSALRQGVALAGLPPVEYALHSLRIECSTCSAAGGALSDILRRKRTLGRGGRSPAVSP